MRALSYVFPSTSFRLSREMKPVESTSNRSKASFRLSSYHHGATTNKIHTNKKC